jgi:hypothetical protein
MIEFGPPTGESAEDMIFAWAISSMMTHSGQRND